MGIVKKKTLLEGTTRPCNVYHPATNWEAHPNMKELPNNRVQSQFLRGMTPGTCYLEIEHQNPFNSPKPTPGTWVATRP